MLRLERWFQLVNVGLGGGHGARPRYFVVSAERLRRIIYHVSPSFRSLSRTNTSQAVLIVEIATCVVDASSFFYRKDFRHFLAVDVENSIRVWQQHLVPSSIKPELPTLLFFFRSTSHSIPATLHGCERVEGPMFE